MLPFQIRPWVGLRKPHLFVVTDPDTTYFGCWACVFRFEHAVAPTRDEAYRAWVRAFGRSLPWLNRS